MKKQFTLLSVLTVAATFSFAQTNLTSMPKTAKQPVRISVSDKAVVSETPKDGGDLIWSDDFSGTATWVIDGDGDQGTFVIGSLPAAMSQYMGGAMTNGTAPLAFFNGVQYLIAQSVQAQNAWIQSPAIDMSASEIVTVQFNQKYRRFNHDEVYLEVSLDSGATWEYSYKLNGEAVGNGPSLQNTQTIDVPIGPGVTDGIIRFRWESLTADNAFGSGYGWAIDNVKVLEGYESNVSMYQTFSVFGTQGLSVSKIPASQAADAGNISFGAIIKNTGASTQPVSLKVTNGSYTDTSAAVDIASFEQDSLFIETANGWAIPTTAGTSSFVYTALSDSILGATSDDSKTVAFEVTSSVMAADAYDGTSASMAGAFEGWQNGDGDAEIGTFFEVFTAESVGAIHIGVGSVGEPADYIGRSLFGKLYDLTTGAPVLINATEEHIMAAGEFGKIVKTYFLEPVELVPGNLYLATASTFEGAPVPIAFSGFVADNNVAGFNGTAFTGLLPNDFYGNVVECPIVRLDFKDYTGIEELVNASSVNAYPNPFNASTEIAFELTNEAPVSIVVTDLTGREVMNLGTQSYTAGKHTVTVNGTDLKAGVYNYTITVGNNVVTKRIVKK